MRSVKLLVAAAAVAALVAGPVLAQSTMAPASPAAPATSTTKSTAKKHTHGKGVHKKYHKTKSGTTPGASGSAPAMTPPAQ